MHIPGQGHPVDNKAFVQYRIHTVFETQPDCPLQPTQSICFCTSWLSVFLQKDSFPRVSEIDNPKRGNPAKREEILIEVQTEALENNAQQENRYIKDARLSRSPGK
ncbi:uncharacterized protein ACHE_30439S [Aspergillus chevalieri]|uniref:Uncharacterized protein n=1 Tax=Aspergillus chevalieri TaxID=182096 RepID=A0A7R7VL48_ASPCH|nr:uncharacterized protein ACHE_30439S [Aspergillus chevalieri]BCR86452.1 hypothetical protein ACHE_30439S [Aspergillus chevalieri]